MGQFHIQSAPGASHQHKRLGGASICQRLMESSGMSRWIPGSLPSVLLFAVTVADGSLVSSTASRRLTQTRQDLRSHGSLC